ncbi:hypothetical protein [Brevibacillus sp. SIMBA_040]|uniref:hypothetical protein n=1 Tax=unclassified Brevibacillus TaxID=2684853 RepID=UPI00397E4B7E
MIFRKVGNKTTALIIGCFFIAAFIFTLYSYFAGKAAHKEVIQEFIGSQGGTVISIESVSLDLTPFPVYSENGRRRLEAGHQFYKVTYTKNGSEYSAWYRGVNGPFAIHQQTQTRSGVPIEETPENEQFVYRYGERWIFAD